MNYTVSELIEKLKQYPQDACVYVLDNDGYSDFNLKIEGPEFVMGYECVGLIIGD